MGVEIAVIVGSILLAVAVGGILVLARIGSQWEEVREEWAPDEPSRADFWLN